MKMKKLFLFLVCVCLAPLGAMAQKGYYNFDNIGAKSILNLFLQAKEEGRKYPTLEQFAAADISPADIEFVRSHVKRRALVDPTDRLNKNVYENRKLLMCLPMGDGMGGVTAYPDDKMEHSDTYSMWNYTELFGSWNHAFFQAPGSWVDAAHKNGTRIMSGKMMFDSSFGGASPDDWIEFFSKKDENGNFIYVEPFINALMFFGSDGITYNWEASRYDEEDVVNFHKALYQKAREYGFLDYNSLMYTNFSTLTGYNADALYGTKENPVHELFLNYAGYNISSQLDESQAYAEANCGGAERLYVGVYLDRMDRNYSVLSKKGAEHIGLATWGEHERSRFISNTEGATDETWQADYQNLLERYFSGGNNNPANRPEAADNASYADNMQTFEGMAEYFPERSTIQGTLPFCTYFNLGHGEYYYVNGTKTTKGGWYNMGAQDLVPTYRWLIYDADTETPNTSLEAAFTRTDAYVGGSCLSVKGETTGGADIILYKTALKLGAGAKAKIALKAVDGNPTVSLLIKADGVWKVYDVDMPSSSWHESVIDIFPLAGANIERIGIRYTGSGEVLVGKIELNDKQTVEPAPIKAVGEPVTVSESIEDVSVKLYWEVDATPDEFGRSYNSDNNIDHFEIVYQPEGSNEEIEIGRTSQWATLAAHVPFPSDQTSLKVGVRSVSTDLKTKSPVVWVSVPKGTPTTEVDPADISGQDGIYDINFNEKTPHMREDRYIKHVGLTDEAGTLQKFPDNDSETRITQQLYFNATEKAVFDVVAGQSYTPYVDYLGLWMSCYCYVDWDNSGDFSITDNITFDDLGKPTRTDYCEVVSFSGLLKDDGYPWYKSDGTMFNDAMFPKPGFLLTNMPAFRVPEDLVPGTYRMRVKLDWNCLDPGGNTSPKDLIYNNGGDIIDVLLNVHEAEVELGADSENGKVEKDGFELTTEMDATAPFKEDLPLVFTPEEGYQLTGAIVRHGYNLFNEEDFEGDGKWNDVGNRQWWEEKLDFTDGNYTIPARLINGNVLITPIFANVNSITSVNVNEIKKNNVYDLTGRIVRQAGSEKALAPGVYLVKGKKFVVK
jgi:endo-beta-N-acetylglucosaminidase D